MNNHRLRQAVWCKNCGKFTRIPFIHEVKNRKKRNTMIGILAKQVRECKKCILWKERKNPVVGDGDTNTEIVFIGEAPGKNEDLQGKLSWYATLLPGYQKV